MIYLPIVILALYLIIDTYLLRKARKNIKLVIHVNGTRGKSSVVRMLDEVFRQNGYRTFSKVTGTLPMYRDCNGNEHHINRNAVTILEQKTILKRAAKDLAEVLIIECMALKDTVQEHSEHILKADIAVITNVRTDHLEIMGTSKDEIARTMFKMTSKKQTIIVGDCYLKELYPDSDIICADHNHTLENEIKENTNIVLEIVQQLGLDVEKSITAIQLSKKDVGSKRVIEYQSNEILFGFSMNDLETTNEFYKTYKPNGKQIIWFNDRKDRPMRSLIFLNWLIEVSPDEIILSGDRVTYNKSYLKKEGFTGKVFNISSYQGNNQLILGIGNMKGLDYLLGEVHV